MCNNATSGKYVLYDIRNYVCNNKMYGISLVLIQFIVWIHWNYSYIFIFQSILINSINNIITVDMIDVDKILSFDSFQIEIDIRKCLYIIEKDRENDEYLKGIFDPPYIFSIKQRSKLINW